MSEIAASYGKTFSAALRVRVLGASEENTARIFNTELNLPISIAEFNERFESLSTPYLMDAPLLDGKYQLTAFAN